MLDRPQRRGSLFVWRKKGERTLIFWRSERSMRSTRPGVRTPTARGLAGPLTIVVDDRERYAWRFAKQAVVIERRRLPAGDYGVIDEDVLIAAVERKRLRELAGDAVQGKLQLAMGELGTLPRAVVIVEGRLSQLLRSEVPVQPGWLLNLVAALQAANPNIPILFAETGPPAADLAYRWLSACLRLARDARAGRSTAETIAAATSRSGGPTPPAIEPPASSGRWRAQVPARASRSAATPKSTASITPRLRSTFAGWSGTAVSVPRGEPGRCGSTRPMRDRASCRRLGVRLIVTVPAIPACTDEGTA